MGATVTTGKAVLAFQAKNEIIYVLFEESYEQNCYPHEPNWCCFAIGNYQQVMTKIFGRASAAEGGSLTNRAKNLTPETYLRGWNLAFHKPMMFNNRDISFRILERGCWLDGIESNRAGRVHDVLKATNRMDVWEKLISEDDKVTLSLYDDIDLIVSLFGVNGIEPPWRIINAFSHRGMECLGFIPAKYNGGKYPSAMPRLTKFVGNSTTYFAEMQNDGTFANHEWEYRVIANYVQNQAYHCEMVERGFGVKNIKIFREILDNEPDCSSDFDAFIDKSTITPDLIRQFEYNVGIKFEDAEDVIKLPSVQFALDRVNCLLKVYFKRKNTKGASNDLLMAA